MGVLRGLNQEMHMLSTMPGIQQTLREDQLLLLLV